LREKEGGIEVEGGGDRGRRKGAKRGEGGGWDTGN